MTIVSSKKELNSYTTYILWMMRDDTSCVNYSWEDLFLYYKSGMAWIVNV